MDILQKATVFQGDTISGTVNMSREIPPGSVITMYFKGTSISSLDSNEITITDYAQGLFYYKIPRDKSLQLVVGTAQSIDIVLLTPTNDHQTFEAFQVLDVRKAANA